MIRNIAGFSQEPDAERWVCKGKLILWTLLPSEPFVCCWESLSPRSASRGFVFPVRVSDRAQAR